MAQQTPKEKAEKLIMKMSFETHAYNAKSCALAAVNEIIEVVFYDPPCCMYWEEVKKEIEKI